MTLSAKWEKDQSKNTAEQTDIIPIFKIRSAECWIHDSNYSCVLVEHLDNENVILEGVNGKTKNTLTRDDLKFDLDAKLGYWRYDIRRKATINCKNGAFSETQLGTGNQAS